MNTRQEFKGDPLREYLSPKMVENAPSDFTEKVMARVILEAKPLKAVSSRRRRSYVPAISLAVILILTCIAFSLPSSAHEFTSMRWMRMLHNINLPELKLNLDFLSKLHLPGYVPYLFISIFFLTVFDRALNGLFHREK